MRRFHKPYISAQSLTILQNISCGESRNRPGEDYLNHPGKIHFLSLIWIGREESVLTHWLVSHWLSTANSVSIAKYYYLRAGKTDPVLLNSIVNRIDGQATWYCCLRLLGAGSKPDQGEFHAMIFLVVSIIYNSINKYG